MSPKFVVGVLVSIIAAVLIVNKGIVFGNDHPHQNRVHVTSQMSYQSITSQIQMRSDRDGALGLEDISSDLYQSQFAHLGSPTINLGYSNHVYWFRVMLDNSESETVDLMLEIPFPLIDKIDGYLTNEDLEALVVKETFQYGDHYEFSKRPILSPSFVQPLKIDPGASWLFLKVETSSPVHVPIYVADDQSYAEYITIKQWLSGILYGIAFALACYNFMLFSALRDKIHLYYGLFLVSLFLFYACVDGYSYWLWPDNINWQSKAHIYFIYMSLGLGVEFSRRYLSISELQPRLMQHMHIIIGVCVSCILITPFLQEVYAATLMSVVSGASLTYMFIVGLLRLRDGVPLAGLYVLVWGMLIVTAFMNVLASNGLMFDFMDVNGYMKIASVVELLLLSFGVGSKLNAIRDKQIRAERHALHFSEEARRAEKRALEVEREANKTLEEKVHSRTKQLEDAMKDLHRANDELKRLSETDSLTGLYNRRKFEECFNEKILYANQHDAQALFMFIDIDHFKKFNDQFGHDMGDLCLQKVAFRLAELADKFGFVVGRFGGEEFAVATVVSQRERAAQLGEIIRAEIEKLRIPNHDDIRVTVSIGCHLEVNPPIEERSRLMKHADVALYRAKANGRNCVLFDDQLHQGTATVNSISFTDK